MYGNEDSLDNLICAVETTRQAQVPRKVIRARVNTQHTSGAGRPASASPAASRARRSCTSWPSALPQAMGAAQTVICGAPRIRAASSSSSSASRSNLRINQFQVPHAIDAMLSPRLHLLDGVEVHEGLRTISQDNLIRWLISHRLGLVRDECPSVAPQLFFADPLFAHKTESALA